MEDSKPQISTQKPQEPLFRTEQEAIQYLEKYHLMNNSMTKGLLKEGKTYQRIAEIYATEPFCI